MIVGGSAEIIATKWLLGGVHEIQGGIYMINDISFLR